MTEMLIVSNIVLWVLVVILALVVLALVIGSLVPRRSGGPAFGGVGMDDLHTACKMAGRDDRDLCQRVFRVEAALDDGRCSAAQAMARPILTLPDDTPPFRAKLRDYTLARLKPCEAAAPDASPEG